MREGYHWFSAPAKGKHAARYYLYKHIRCGKKYCRRCPHGPYLYERRLIKVGRARKRREIYVGKVGSEAEQKILSDLLAFEAHLETSIPF